MKALQLTVAALGGALVGAAAALLLAPQEGKTTRKLIRKFVQDKCPGCKCPQEVNELADELEDELKDRLDSALSTGKK